MSTAVPYLHVLSRITERLWISDFEVAACIPKLVQHQIKLVCNISKQAHEEETQAEYKKAGIAVHQFAIGDDLESNIVEVATKVLELVTAHATSNVLVHCQMGLSRSPAVVIFLLMMQQGLGYDDAYKLVLARRRTIQPNESFEQQLRSLEKKTNTEEQE
jgi:protein-tyrosine phosphatase